VSSSIFISRTFRSLEMNISRSRGRDDVLCVGPRHGRSHPLSSGQIPWFDVQGDIRRCDWLENSHFFP
jgi:hypothetical protein